MSKIYLDHAATTPIDKKVLRKMMPYFYEKYGNSMALHSFGRVASEAIEKARNEIANFLNCTSSEIIFTSGATESNNLALKGFIKKFIFIKKNKRSKPHIITTQFEHHCILEACKFLENSGQAKVTYLPVYNEGIVKISDIKKAIKPNTILMSIMYVNNEVGTVQPIAEIGKLVKKINSNRENGKKLIFHTDATQAIGYFDCNVKKLGVDMLSFSGHKIYGPKGVGALYAKNKAILEKIQDGGHQEAGKRAGTHNVPGIVGLGEAITQIKKKRNKNNNIKSLRDYLIRKVLKEIPDSKLNGSKIKRSPNNANFGFKNIEGESLILMLDKYSIACSTGSACSSHSLEPSHVLLALGIKPEEAHGSLRITLGKDTKKKDIDYTIEVLKKSIKKLRQVSGNILNDYHSTK